MNEFTPFLELLQGGGNLALVLACYFIFKAEQRLSRIEKALEIFLQHVGNVPTLKDHEATPLDTFRTKQSR